MRIIGGQYRSRLISMPKGAHIRPTQDRVREAVFNLLGDVSGRRVLDLFAGSGAFGMEAISRGAIHATFVENDRRCAEMIRRNLLALGIDAGFYYIITGNALKVFPKLAEREGAKKFDLIFLDPPYHRDIAKNCLINIGACDILTRTGLVVVERFRKDELEPAPGSLVLEKERRYADTVISIFRKRA